MNLTVCQRYGFFSVLTATICESSDNLPCIENRALPFIHQPDRVAPKASDVSPADWLYQLMWKKKTIFSRVCCCGFSQGRKSLYNTTVYVIIAELAERSPIIIQNSSNPSSRKNLDVRPHDRRGHWAPSRTTRVLVLAAARRCALETYGEKKCELRF